MPLPAARQDLLISPQVYLGKTVYVVKDPVSLTYFRLSPAERYILRQLDGNRSAAELAELARAKFLEHHIDAREVLRFYNMLQGAGLILGRDLQHAPRLRQMHERRKRRKRRATAISFLFLRVPIFDPDRMLDWLYRGLGPLMNRWTAALSLLFMFVSGLAAIVGLYRVGDLAFPVLSWTNLILLSVVFFVVKVIHEFGHGLAAKHRRLEVHEMGILFIVFLPLFYVDVSDAWILPRKKDRLWINAGGVYIEFLLAAIAVWVWLASEPGWVNQCAFNIMLAASVTTLLFNANPLLKYDGYYFLMDMLEIPNLRAKASQYLGYVGKRYLLAMPDQHPPQEVEHKPIFMSGYAVASTVYRWIVVLGIVALVWHKLDDYGLEAVGALMGIVAAITMICLPIYKVLAFVWRVQAATPRRLAITGVVLVLLSVGLWGLMKLPIEQTVDPPAVVLAERRQPLYTAVTGRLAEVYHEPGDWVEAGAPVIRLTNEQLEERQQKARIRRRIAALELRNARREGRTDVMAAAELEVAQYDQQLAHLDAQVEKLTLRAPFAGRLMPSTRLDAAIGARVEQGQEIGRLIADDRLCLYALLPEKQRDLVAERMTVEARLWSMPWRTLSGRVGRIAAQTASEMPHPAMSAAFGGEVRARTDRGEGRQPAQRSVAVEIDLDPETLRGGLPLLDGMTGRASILVGRRQLGQQTWSWLRDAVSLDWWL